VSTSPATWQNNTSVDELAAFLRGKRRIVVLTHIKPDGDAAGSTLALVRALNTPAPWVNPGRAEAWYYGPLPPWLEEIAGDTPRRTIGKDGPPQLDDVDAVVVMDTGSWVQVEPVKEWLAARHDVACVIDHHVQGDGEIAPRRCIQTKVAATCQIAAHLCARILDVATPAKLPKAIATPLYLGLATDTGWFRHSNVTHAVMGLAGELLDAGADHVWLYQRVEQQETMSRLKLLSRALASLEVHDEGRLAIMCVTRADFAWAKSNQGESGGFTDFGQAMPGVRVTAVLTEATLGDFGHHGARAGTVLTKISLRSKDGDNAVDVNLVAKALGGGGHIRAAGARMDANLAQAKAEIIRLVSEQTARPQ
jgi:phosphoesterase RecJ-like protein